MDLRQDLSSTRPKRALASSYTAHMPKLTQWTTEAQSMHCGDMFAQMDKSVIKL